jgi:hypothetical protein
MGAELSTYFTLAPHGKLSAKPSPKLFLSIHVHALTKPLPGAYLGHAKATPLEAQRAAGHGSLDMTYLYTLADTERERAQVQAIFDKLMELPSGLTQ